jgi:murein DD-endopeptidase MepM/ murein hydrolase activator NlpD
MLLLTASCVSYEAGKQPGGGPAAPRLPQPVARPAPPIVTAPLQVAPQAGDFDSRRERGVHRARSGETVYSVARQYGVDAYALITANNLVPPFDLYEGQRLVIPGASRPAVVAGPTASETNPERPAARPSVTSPREPSGQTARLPRAAAPPEPPEGTSGFVWPVEGSVISDFGAKGGGRYNDGINIAAAAGTPVRAAESGIVAYAGNEVRGFGNMLLLKHSNGWVTAYAHNSELLVRRGERVQRGQVIARVGQSGSVDRPQLHFEIRKGKRAVDPGQELPRPSAAARGREAG